MYMYILNINYDTSSSACIWRCVCELSMSIYTLDLSTRHMTLSIYRRLHYTHTCTCTSLVPWPLPVFNDTRKENREDLVREVTSTSFRWKGGGRVIIVCGPMTCLWVVLAVPMVPGTGTAINRSRT